MSVDLEKKLAVEIMNKLAAGIKLLSTDKDAFETKYKLQSDGIIGSIFSFDIITEVKSYRQKKQTKESNYK